MSDYRSQVLKVYNYFSSAHGARLIIMFIDLVLGFFSFFIAVLLDHHFEFPSMQAEPLIMTFSLVLVIKLIMFRLFKTYVGIIRFTGEKDIVLIFTAASIATAILLIISSLLPSYDTFYIPRPILLIDWLLMALFQIGTRVLMRLVYTHVSSVKLDVIPVAVFGAGTCGNITLKAIASDNLNPMKVVAFFDDSPQLQGKSLTGIKIHNPQDDFKATLEKHKVKKVIIAIQDLPFDRKEQFVEQCLDANVKVMVVPPVSKWLNNDFQVQQIRQIKIEDLLNRQPIELHKDHISKELEGEVVLITGAAGSIGSEIARQVASYSPKKLILLDQSESPLWEHFLYLKELYTSEFIEVELGDVRNFERLEDMFIRYKPSFVFHAAAYKHVPILESFPEEAIKINVMGVKNMADLAVAHQVKKFVFVSTDKAVNPTNVMGASKRIAEIYVQALNKHESNTCTRFITTRFGNVLGSNGSVVPRFERQISNGGPITVTHKNITRYFMTIPEACQLVLEAGIMGQGGEIFVFDMGKAIKISDLAKKMIQLAGLQEGKDIDIVYTGLREGEKLYEELLSSSENTMPTHHEKIMIGKSRQYDYDTITQKIKAVCALVESHDNQEIVGAMKDIVPEFISNASRYEALDKKDVTK